MFDLCTLAIKKRKKQFSWYYLWISICTTAWSKYYIRYSFGCAKVLIWLCMIFWPCFDIILSYIQTCKSTVHHSTVRDQLMLNKMIPVLHKLHIHSAVFSIEFESKMATQLVPFMRTQAPNPFCVPRPFRTEEY